ncbi:Ran-binding proteins 9/10, partial [Globisporangium splendens]
MHTSMLVRGVLEWASSFSACSLAHARSFPLSRRSTHSTPATRMDLLVSVLCSGVLDAVSARLAAADLAWPSKSKSKTPQRTLNDVPDAVLAQILAYVSARDVEAATVASKVIAFQVVPQYPIWKTIFCRRWEKINFPLDGALCEEFPTSVEIDGRLRKQFPSVVPLSADITHADYHPDARRFKDFAYSGPVLGGDRSVRANAAFPTTLHVQVFKRKIPNTRNQFAYQIGVARSGYFEITISRRREQKGPFVRLSGRDMASIGVGTERFRLVDRQPGWDEFSFGYHGDDGRFYHDTGNGHHFGPAFDIGDTVGCGVRRSGSDQTRSSVFFTNNGDLLPSGDRDIASDYDDWFPVVGVDSPNAVHVNFGQEPFRYDGVIDELFDECREAADLVTTHLPWHRIFDEGECDSDDGQRWSGSDDDDDEPRLYLW